MFYRASREVGKRFFIKERIVKAGKRLLYIFIVLLHERSECRFKSSCPAISVMPSQKIEKMKKVCSIKGTMRKIYKRTSITFFKVHDKIIGCMIHPMKQPIGRVDNTLTISPG